jgi:hypothetical protein
LASPPVEAKRHLRPHECRISNSAKGDGAAGGVACRSAVASTMVMKQPLNEKGSKWDD